MCWKKILILAAAAILLLIAVAYIFVATYDFNKLKPVIAQAVKNATGRELTIGGDLKFRFGIIPKLSAEDIHFQNATWGSRPDLASVKRLDMQIALLSLARGTVQFRQLTLLEPDVILETNPSGGTNFRFERREKGKSTVVPNLGFTDVLVEKGIFTYRDLETGKSFPIQIERLRTKIPDMTKAIQLSLEASYLQKPCQVDGIMVPLSTFIQPEKAFPVNLTARSGSISVEVEGEIADVIDFKNLSLSVSVKGDSLPDLLAFFEIHEVPDLGPFKLKARLADPAQKLAVDEIDFGIGTHELAAIAITGAIRDLIAFRNMDLNFTAEGTDVANLTAIGLPAPLVRDPFKAAGRIYDTATGNYTISDLLVTIGQTDIAGSIDLDLAADPYRLMASFSSQETPQGPFTLTAQLVGPVDQPALEKLNVRLGTIDLSEVIITGVIKNLRDLEGVELDFSGRGKRLAHVEELIGRKLPIQGSFAASGRLSLPKHKLFTVPNLNLVIGRCRLAGKLQLDVTGKEPKLDVALSTPKLNLQSVLKDPPKGLPGLGTLPNLGPLDLSIKAVGFTDNFEIKHLDVRVGTDGLAKVHVSGAIQRPTIPDGIDLKMTIQGRDMANIQKITGQALPVKGPFSLSGRVRSPKPKIFQTEDLQLRVGENDINGFVRMNLATQPSQLEAHLASQRFNLEPLSIKALPEMTSIPDLGHLNLKAKLILNRNALTLEQIAVSAGTLEFADLNLNGTVKNLTALQGLELEFQVRGRDIAKLEQLIGKSVPLRGPYAVSGHIHDPAAKSYKVENSELTVGQTKLQGALNVDLTAGHPRLALAVSSPSFSLKPLAVGDNEIIEALASEPDLGPLNLSVRLTPSGKTWEVENLDLKAGSSSLAELQLTGSVKNLVDFQGIDLTVDLKGSDVKALSKLTGRPTIAEGPYRVSGRLHSPAPKIYDVEDFKLAFEGQKDDLAGSFQIDLSGRRPLIHADLMSQQFDYRPYLTAVLAESPEEAAPHVKTKKKLFSDKPIPFDQLHRFDGNIKLRAGKLLTHMYAFNDAALHVVIMDGTVVAEPITFKIGGGTGQGSLHIKSQGSSGIIDQTMSLKEVDIGPMLEDLGYGGIIDAKVDHSSRLTSTGASLAELMANVTGHSHMVMDHGRIALKYLGMLQGNLAQDILKLINPFQKKGEFTDFNCLVNRVDVNDGLADLKLLLDTEQTTIVAGGEINLKTETLDVGIKPSPKKGFGVSGIGQVDLSLSELAKPFKLGGTLTEPSKTVDAARAGWAIGKALGGFALFGPFGVLAILSDISIGSKETCLEAIEAARIDKQPSENQKQQAPDKDDKTEQKKKGFFERLLGR